jgi:hypothetical protein
MERRTVIFLIVPLTLALGAAAFGYSIASERAAPVLRKAPPSRRALVEACGSNATYARLKARLFDEAATVRGSGTGELDLLAGSTVVRVEEPLVKAQDERLGVTVCTGEFIVELPPGAEKGFAGLRRLNARIEYAAQKAADGSGIVYQLRGAEPIIYRLAAFGLSGAPPEAAPVLPAAAPLPVDPAPAAIAAAAPVEPAKEMKRLAQPLRTAEGAPAKAVKKVEVPEPAVAEKKAAPKKTNAKAEVKSAVKMASLKGKPVRTPAKKKSKTAPLKAAKKTEPKLAPKKKAEPKQAPKPAAARKAAKKTPSKPVLRQAAMPACRSGSRAVQLACANPALAGKERRVTTLYYSALENADRDTAQLLRSTASNFRSYLAGCATEACVSQAFDGRMREIRDILSGMR